MPTIKFLKQKKSVEVPEGTNLRKAAMQAGVDVYDGIHKTLHCPGIGMCCSCRMNIKKGQKNCSSMGFWEKLSFLGLNNGNPLGFFARIGHEDEMRLSCQTRVNGDCEVETTPDMNFHGEKFWS